MTSSTLQPELDDLRTRVSGTVTGQDHPGYDEARTVWNGMMDRRPRGVVRAAGVSDVAPTIGFAREHGLDLAVRGGGHDVAGNGTVDDGLVLDSVISMPCRSTRRRRPCASKLGPRWPTSTRRPSRTGSSCRWGWCPAPASRGSPSAEASAG